MVWFKLCFQLDLSTERIWRGKERWRAEGPGLYRMVYGFDVRLEEAIGGSDRSVVTLYGSF